MKKNLCKPCICGHDELCHYYGNKTPTMILDDVILAGYVTPIYSPNMMKPVGYRFNNKIFSFNEMIVKLDDLKKTQNSCRSFLYPLFKKCGCKCYKMNNLKYLEDLSECSTS